MIPAAAILGALRAKVLIWRPRRDLNPRLRRESREPNRKRKKPQEPERTGWRSTSCKKQLNVSPMCPRPRVRNCQEQLFQF